MDYFHDSEASLQNLLWEFHWCTKMGIAGFSETGTLLYAIHMEHFLTVMRPKAVHRLVQSGEISSKGKVDEVHLPDGSYWAVVTTGPRSLEHGYVVFGPFSDQPDAKGSRPRSITPHLTQLLRSLQESMCLKPCPRRGKGHRHQCSRHVRRVLAYVAEHYGDTITLDSAAQYLGINKSYLSSLFKEETGVTFSQWLNRVRIERSQKLLKHHDHSLADIAWEVGYSSQPYFTAMFKKHTGLTPHAYRQRWR